jgi:tetratricopeptide (TPR) repeat protein
MDPTNSVQQSISSSQKTLELGGDVYATAYSIAGRALLVEAQYKILIGENPADLFTQSIAKITKALNSGSNEPQTLYTALLNNYWMQADSQIDKNVDPSAALENARKIYKKATSELHDNNLEIWNARLEILNAKWHIQKSQLAEWSLNAANDSLQKALKQTSKDPFLFVTVAELMEAKAGWLQRKHQPIDDTVSQGLSFTKRALEINPKQAEAFIEEGKLYAIAGKSDQAKQSFQQAFAINSNLKRKYSWLLPNP